MIEIKANIQKLEHLGHGSFARVYKVLDQQTNRYLAAKIISKSSLQYPNIKPALDAELFVNRVLKHENIVRFHCCFSDTENVYVLFDYCENKRPGEQEDIIETED